MDFFGLQSLLDLIPVFLKAYHLEMCLLRKEEKLLKQGSGPRIDFPAPILTSSSAISLP